MKVTLMQEGAVPVTRGNIGAFFEDVNYALDGGLYAELLENRNFEGKKVCGAPDRRRVKEAGSYAWSVYPEGADVSLKIKTDRYLFPENPHYLRVTAAQGGTGVTNGAYDGIFLKKGEEYQVSFYLRSYDYRGKVRAGVWKEGIALAQKAVRVKPTGSWRKYTFRLKAKEDAERARFCFLLDRAGSVHVDAFSMMPANALSGLFRRDLVQYLKDLKPGFLRFPGSCSAEGGVADRYRWKESLGQRERRKHNWNGWAVYGAAECNGFCSPYCHYGQTLGVGFFEYFRLCEYLGCKPLPVIGFDADCRKADGEGAEWCVQEALDVVEFARGGADTVWGRVRADMGHPQPFPLEYLELVIGERGACGDGACLELIAKRLHEKHPDLKLIVGAADAAECAEFICAFDEHRYVPSRQLYADAHRYDGHPRTGKVFVGEYAACNAGEGCGHSDGSQAAVWEGALAEAAFLTGMERNADVVVMSSHAPVFARLGYAQRGDGLVWFDGNRSYATANYYVQQLYSLYTGDVSLKASSDDDKVFVSATVRDNQTFVKLVNASGEEKEAEISGDHDFGALMRIVRMQADPADRNTAEAPGTILPEEIAPAQPHAVTLPPHSFQVLVFMK